MKPFNQGKPGLSVRGMTWDREGNTWRRYLLRRHSDGSSHWSEVHYVDGRYPVCPWCLSQHLLFDTASSTTLRRWYRCEPCAQDFCYEVS